jgi:hypothetical protein
LEANFKGGQISYRVVEPMMMMMMMMMCKKDTRERRYWVCPFLQDEVNTDITNRKVLAEL